MARYSQRSGKAGELSFMKEGVESERPVSVRTLHVSVLLILGFALYFFLFLFPLAGSFQYWHVAAMSQVQTEGHFRAGDENGGFYAVSAMIASVTGISPEIVSVLPLQAIPFILFFVILIRNASVAWKTPMALLLSILGLAYVMKFGSKSNFIWGTHDLGFILFLQVALLLLMNHRNKNVSDTVSRVSPAAIIMVSIAALNFVSYKVTLLVIVFLITMTLIESLGYRLRSSIISLKTLKNLALFSLVYVLSYNAFFYNIALPSIRFARDTFGQTGIDKFTYTLGPLSQYAFIPPGGLRYGDLLWAALSMIGLAVFVSFLVFRLLRKASVPVGTRLMLGVGISGGPMLVFYTYLGILEPNYLIFAGFAALVPLFALGSKRIRRFVVVCAILFVALNISQNLVGLPSHYYDGLHDSEFSSNGKVSSRWYTDNVDLPNSTGTSDIFTIGLIAYVAEQDSMGHPNMQAYSEEDILYLLNPVDHSNRSVASGPNYFMMNNKLDHFSMRGWISIRSWSNYREDLANNQNIQRIYSSGDVDIYLDLSAIH